jgi:hypothetical protein
LLPLWYLSGNFRAPGGVTLPSTNSSSDITRVCARRRSVGRRVPMTAVVADPDGIQIESRQAPRLVFFSAEPRSARRPPSVPTGSDESLEHEASNMKPRT